MNNDRGETVDLAPQHPDIVNELLGEWDQYVKANQVLIPAPPPAAKRTQNSL